MEICIFEDNEYAKLNPLVLTRPVYELRCGMTTLREKIARQFPDRQLSLHCRDYLADAVREDHPDAKVNEIASAQCLFINGRVLADEGFANKMDPHWEGVYHKGQTVVAAMLKGAALEKVKAQLGRPLEGSLFQGLNVRPIEAKVISYPWELVHENASQIEADFEFLNAGGKIEGKLYDRVTLLEKENIFVGPGSTIKPGVVLDAEGGPIYIGRKVTILPNAVLEGPAFVGDGSIIKIGAKIYEGTSIGEVCKVGGEVEESIIHSYSNKQHDGFLGHAYLGSWINLGANTNNSDLKNNYGSIKVYINGQLVDSGSQFVGLFMGDHSKSGINTMFNTGTVVGVMCNVYGGGYPPKFIPSFVWGGAEGLVEYQLEKALDTARRVMARRKVELTPAKEKVLRTVFELTKTERMV
ncbi:MAG: GlmU family protein [candidate division KSB1 bacterium]|nr:GlmU family protein [candidate division KSB1 bacterium]